MKDKRQENFLQLYEPVHERFERFCRARVYGKMDHRDLMNETLLLAFEKIESLRTREAFLSFLFGIAIRILANASKKKNEEGIKDEKKALNLVDPGESADKNADIHLLYRALDCLPDEQKESLILFEISGFSIREISELHQASESAVKQRLKRGRERLAELLTYTASELKGEMNDGK